MRKIHLAERKYTIVYDDETSRIVDVLRHGASWPAFRLDKGRLRTDALHRALAEAVIALGTPGTESSGVVELE